MSSINHALAPCPFCGGTPEMTFNDVWRNWVITCSSTECPAEMSISLWPMEKAVERWNGRSTQEGSFLLISIDTFEMLRKATNSLGDAFRFLDHNNLKSYSRDRLIEEVRKIQPSVSATYMILTDFWDKPEIETYDEVTK